MSERQPVTPEHVLSVLQKLGVDGRILSIRPSPGSFSNFTDLVTIETAAGQRRNLVVRRYAVFGDYDRGEKANREFKTLQLLHRHHIPAPMPLLLDATGDLLGSPGIVTARVPGRQVIIPKEVAGWLGQLARTLAQIHAIPLTQRELDFLLDSDREVVWFLNGGQVTDEMAAHAHGRAVWHAVQANLHRLRPVPPALVHIDYWLGNILWQEGRMTAVLDWEEAACGDPGYDVAYLRLELAMLGGKALADQFLAAYVAEKGQPVPNLAFWELAAAARFMPIPEGMIPEWQTFGPVPHTPASVNANFNQFIAYALQEVG